MIVEFTVNNFRSLRDEQTLSAAAGADRTRLETNTWETGDRSVRRVNRACLMLGANASGKSNLIAALATLRTLVLQSTALPAAGLAAFHAPFALDRSSTKEPTDYQIVLVLNGVRYQYGFSHDAERIRAEWLIVYKTGKGQTWFKRSWNAARGEYDWAPFSIHFTGARDLWRQALRPTALFLTTAVQLNSELLRPLGTWFQDGMEIVSGTPGSQLERTLRRLIEPAHRTRVIRLLRRAGLTVTDINTAALSPDGEPTHARLVHRDAGQSVAPLPLHEESAGTRRIVEIAGPIVDALERGTLLVVDDLDAHLHPLAVRHLLGLFCANDSGRRGAQIWASAHDASLLDANLLRRDQIWLLEPDARRTSRLIPLTASSPRKGEALQRGYLAGRYGGVPAIGPGLDA